MVLEILPSSECYGHRSLLRGYGLDLKECRSYPCHWVLMGSSSIIVLSQGSARVDHQASIRSAMRQTSLCLEKLG